MHPADAWPINTIPVVPAEEEEEGTIVGGVGIRQEDKEAQQLPVEETRTRRGREEQGGGRDKEEVTNMYNG